MTHVKIVWDRWGVPYIYGTTNDDVAWALVGPAPSCACSYWNGVRVDRPARDGAVLVKHDQSLPDGSRGPTEVV
jgi:hypothetical protein